MHLFSLIGSSKKIVVKIKTVSVLSKNKCNRLIRSKRLYSMRFKWIQGFLLMLEFTKNQICPGPLGRR